MDEVTLLVVTADCTLEATASTRADMRKKFRDCNKCIKSYAKL